MVDILNKDGRLFTTNSFTNSNSSMNHSTGNTVYMYYIKSLGKSGPALNNCFSCSLEILIFMPVEVEFFLW